MAGEPRVVKHTCTNYSLLFLSPSLIVQSTHTHTDPRPVQLHSSLTVPSMCNSLLGDIVALFLDQLYNTEHNVYKWKGHTRHILLFQCPLTHTLTQMIEHYGFNQGEK